MSTRMSEMINGEEAAALGALQAGVGFVTGYPGSPSKDVFEALQRFARSSPINDAPVPVRCEWAANEKVALEMALGATLGGVPSLMCMKSVGMNVALDAVMCINQSGCPSPLVILLGDDPGAWQSQNEQDTRWLSLMSELPLLEPNTVADAAPVTRYAFELSAREKLPVIVRIIRTFAHVEDEVVLDGMSSLTAGYGSGNGDVYSVSQGSLTASLHSALREKNERIAQEWEGLSFNEVTNDDCESGVIAVGFGYYELQEAIAALAGVDKSFSVLKLTSSHPLPVKTITEFLEGRSGVAILEENEPVVEMQVRALAQARGIASPIFGKLDGSIPRGGELTPRRIGRVLSRITVLDDEVVENLPDPVREPGAGRFCDGCPYPPFYDALKEICEELGLTYTAGSDPGCSVLALFDPYEFLSIKHSMGSSVNILRGLASADPERRCIAIVGDSDLYHSALPGIINAVHSGANMTVIVFDNSGAAYTGCQPHPGMSIRAAEGNGEAFHARASSVTMERVLEAAGVAGLWIESSKNGEALRAIFREALTGEGVKVVVVREPCPFAPIVMADGTVVEPSKEGKIVGE